MVVRRRLRGRLFPFAVHLALHTCVLVAFVVILVDFLAFLASILFA